MDADQRRDLRFAAIFHDIGRVEVREGMDFLADVRPLLRHLNEHWDGSGEPDGQAGEEIPLGARVLLACLAYDGVPERRDAPGALLAEAGTRFDPRVVRALLDVLDEAAPDAADHEALSDSR
jgi:HD-GYP domain-containing protein (c-di-GMP phosphodiesterase class II)